MSTVRIDAGICGFATIVNAQSQDSQFVNLDIKSGCPDIKELSEQLKDEFINSFKEMTCHGIGKVKAGHTFIDTKIYQKSSMYLHCSDCPVPAGIMKTIMLSCGLALPKNATIEILQR